MLRIRLPALRALRSTRPYSTSYTPPKSDLPWIVRPPSPPKDPANSMLQVTSAALFLPMACPSPPPPAPTARSLTRAVYLTSPSRPSQPHAATTSVPGKLPPAKEEGKASSSREEKEEQVKAAPEEHRASKEDMAKGTPKAKMAAKSKQARSSPCSRIPPPLGDLRFLRDPPLERGEPS